MQFRDTIDGPLQQVRARMRMPIPARIIFSAAQPEIGTQINDARRQRLVALDLAHADAVRLRDKQDIAWLQRIWRDEPNGRSPARRAQIGMQRVQIASGVMFRCYLCNLHKWMLQEQPRQFAARIARAAKNCYAHRGNLFVLNAHSVTSPRATASA